MFGLGIGEILVILVIALIFIGPKKLPGLAKTLGKGLGEFQNAMRGINTNIQDSIDNAHVNNQSDSDQLAQEKNSEDQLSSSDSQDDQKS